MATDGKTIQRNNFADYTAERTWPLTFSAITRFCECAITARQTHSQCWKRTFILWLVKTFLCEVPTSFIFLPQCWTSWIIWNFFHLNGMFLSSNLDLYFFTCFIFFQRPMRNLSAYFHLFCKKAKNISWGNKLVI